MRVKNLLKSKKIKYTKIREELLKIFLNSNQPLSYEDIKESISMDKTTFYRNISKFESVKLINSFEANDRKRYFEIAQKPHSHFICIVCNKLECLRESFKINLKDGYRVDNIIISGICRECNLET